MWCIWIGVSVADATVYFPYCGDVWNCVFDNYLISFGDLFEIICLVVVKLEQGLLSIDGQVCFG